MHPALVVIDTHNHDVAVVLVFGALGALALVVSVLVARWQPRRGGLWCKIGLHAMTGSPEPGIMTCRRGCGYKEAGYL